MWHTEFVARCLNNSQVINDAAGYGVSIVPAVVSPGDIYWRCIGVHHLTGPENQGKNNFYLDVINDTGQRMNGVKIAWGWEGQRPDEIQRTQPVVIEKPFNEPGGNIGMHAGQVVHARVAGALSDIVTNVHTGHDDEPGGNMRFHHSFYAVWQLTVASGQQPQPDPDPTPQPPNNLRRFVVFQYFASEGWQPVYEGDSLELALEEQMRRKAGGAGLVNLCVVIAQ